MFCSQCGSRQPDDARFCGDCGACMDDDLASGGAMLDDVTPEPAVVYDGGEGVSQSTGSAFEEMPSGPPDEQPASGSNCEEAKESSSKASQPTKKNTKKKKKFPWKLLLAVLLLAGVVVAAIFGVSAVTASPELTDEHILSVEDEDSLIDELAVYDEWVDNSSFGISSRTVDLVEDYTSSDGGKCKTAHVTIVCENASFRVTSQWEYSFELIDDEWFFFDDAETNRLVEPIGSVSSEKLIAQVPSLMKEIDKANASSSSSKLKLSKLYEQNVEFEVLEEKSTPSSSEVTVSMRGTSGIASYEGTMTVGFVWDGSQWSLDDYSVNDAAYSPHYDALIGAWTGTFLSTGHGDCYGGRANPASITFKSISDDGETAIVDLSFVVHCHKKPDNPVEQDSGDIVVSKSDVLINLDPEKRSYLIHSGETSSSASPYDYDYTVYLQCKEDGSLGLLTSSCSGASFYTISDSYDLVKSE